jgi:SUN domain-containing protein 1/2
MSVQFVLMPGGPIPGECLPLNGSKGYVDIKLRQPIIPTALTYEHVPSSIAYDIRSAPQDLTVVSFCYCIIFLFSDVC